MNNESNNFNCYTGNIMSDFIRDRSNPNYPRYVIGPTGPTGPTGPGGGATGPTGPAGLDGATGPTHTLLSESE